MAAVPVWIAWDTGVLPGPSQASAESTGVLTTSPAAVTSLAWPKEALGLAANGKAVIWEQRDPSADVAGLWSYDVPRPDHRPRPRPRRDRQGVGLPAAALAT